MRLENRGDGVTTAMEQRIKALENERDIIKAELIRLRERINRAPSAMTSVPHNNLAGLQGGTAPDEYYHMAAQAVGEDWQVTPGYTELTAFDPENADGDTVARVLGKVIDALILRNVLPT